MKPALCGCLLLWLACLAGCTIVQPAPHISRDASAGRPVAVYLARRKWHLDVGFAVADLDPSLLAVNAEFRSAHYLFFGFGDRHYVLTRNKSGPVLLRALWPGPALLLVTAIDNTPALAFGQSQVLRIQMSAGQARTMQAFIRGSIPDSNPVPVAQGPYADSAYFRAAQQYSALHTCNTWAAEALRAGGEPLHSGGVIFAGQLWRQAARLAQPGIPAAATP
jgi:uncharacterized protein (TIGR02117 family)